MKAFYFLSLIILGSLLAGCKPKTGTLSDSENAVIALTIEQAENLAKLPVSCIGTEYPNKLGQVLGSENDLGEPSVLHPAFYGCFDWHSSVHGHWSLVRLLKIYPEIDSSGSIMAMLLENISPENIMVEVSYFEGEHNDSYERTYGWAWLLKLAEELHTWDNPRARELESNLQPLTALLCERYIEFLPKLLYPIRVGEHTNTAFGLCFAWDYARTTGNTELIAVIEKRAREFYLADIDCPLNWEPSGYDFLSPCFEEIDLMRRILDKEDFFRWMADFAPGLQKSDFHIDPGRVSDRTDGKLVHLDGLNFSRAWVMYGLAEQYPEYAHLKALANEHIDHSLPNLVNDSYEGGHWLGTFAIYALGATVKSPDLSGLSFTFP